MWNSIIYWKKVQILVRNSSFVLSTKHVMGWVGLKNSQTQPNLIYPGKWFIRTMFSSKLIGKNLFQHIMCQLIRPSMSII